MDQTAKSVPPSAVSDPFGGYSPTLRSCFFKCSALSVSEGYNVRFLDGKSVIEYKSHISGHAKIDDMNSFRIIGTEKKTKEILISIFPLQDSMDDFWKSDRDLNNILIDGDESISDALISFLKHIYDLNDKYPPTAYIYFSESDRELGTSEEWSASVFVDQSLIDIISMHIISGDVEEILVSVNMVYLLVQSDRAPPSSFNEFGLIRKGNSAFNLYGHVASINFSRPKIDSRDHSVQD